MTKIALIGGAKANHGMAFTRLYNGYNEEKALEKEWKGEFTLRVGDDARITHIWDENRADAEESAYVCGIENVVDNMEDVIGNVDGVIFTDDASLEQQKKSFPFLEKGIPCFIDKPLSPDLDEIDLIIETARKNNAAVMSTSCLRFAADTKDLREGNTDIGDIATGMSIGKEWGTRFLFYGIHPMELLFSIVGPGIESVQYVGDGEKHHVNLRWKDGRKFVVGSYTGIAGGFHLYFVGTKATISVTVKDISSAYCDMQKSFVKMVQTGEEQVPIEHTRELLRATLLAEESQKNGGEVYTI